MKQFLANHLTNFIIMQILQQTFPYLTFKKKAAPAVFLGTLLIRKAFRTDISGFYCIWGTLVLFPALYAMPVTMLAQRKATLPFPVSAVLLFAGIVAVYVTADVDQQRVRFRLTNGNMKVWGEDPFFITAKYRRKNGEIAANLLLGEAVNFSINISSV